MRGKSCCASVTVNAVQYSHVGIERLEYWKVEVCWWDLVCFCLFGQPISPRTRVSVARAGAKRSQVCYTIICCSKITAFLGSRA